MTPEIKFKIITANEEGKGYGRIAQELGIQKSTVAKFLTKYKKEGDPGLFLVCPQCGKRFLPISGPIQKRFCSKECKDKWWNANSKRKKHLHTAKCTHCGKLFSSLNKSAKYCSRQCYFSERFGN